MTELLAQKVDWIWNLNPDQMANVDKIPFLQTTRKESMRVGYMQIDAAGRTGRNNPLTKLKVRQAIFHAIDRQTIADKLVTGGSRVPPAPCFPSQFGCDADAAVKYDYDPAKAKALLAEAGYPNGFETELVSYILPQWEASIQSYLGAVGIKARLTHVQVAAGIQRSQKGENPLYLGSWGSYSVNDVAAFLPQYLRARQRGLCARSDAEAVGRGRRLHQRQGDPHHRLRQGDQARNRAGLLGADAHLRVDLRVLEDARTSRRMRMNCRGSSWRSGIEPTKDVTRTPATA